MLSSGSRLVRWLLAWTATTRTHNATTNRIILCFPFSCYNPAIAHTKRPLQWYFR
jgi:hypothetical protein